MLSYIFSRCADPRPLSCREADAILHELRELLDSLPASSHKDIWLGTYEQIRSSSHLDEYSPITGSSALQLSHALAIEILQSNDDTHPDINRIADRRGWWETESYKRNRYGALQLGSGVSYHLCGFLPAVRLALVKRFPHSPLEDPGASWMAYRTRAMLLVKDLRWKNCTVDEKIGELRNAIAEMPSQECLYIDLGDKLLKTGNFESAFDAFSTVLSLPHADTEDRALALYDIACVHACRNEEDLCRQALADSAALKPIDKAWLAQDSDFETVKSAE